jgi:hypothetical protein
MNTLIKGGKIKLLLWSAAVLLAFIVLVRLEFQLNAHPLNKRISNGAPDCSKGIVIRKAGGESGIGHHAVNIAIQNTCTNNIMLKGYPQVKLFGPGGREATVFSIIPSAKTYFLTADPARDVELKPGDEAYFQLEFSSAAGGKACTNISKIEVQFPGYSETYSLNIDMRPCGETVKISPVIAKIGEG